VKIGALAPSTGKSPAPAVAPTSDKPAKGKNAKPTKTVVKQST
jgi:hypothetical protein